MKNAYQNTLFLHTPGQTIEIKAFDRAYGVAISDGLPYVWLLADGGFLKLDGEDLNKLIMALEEVRLMRGKG